ncbi:unnamed protein product [Candidula unifasciata]|uniref:RNA exonuclease 4 n=1 Tax=Candidula unifasciata TaxID=100452 RepID=A0A8S4A0Z3_9EUPU|nr:unnamed protein product [Candidula unifasciata]
MATKVDKYSVLHRKKTKSVTSDIEFKKLTKPFSYPGKSQPSNGTVQSLSQKQAHSKTCIRQQQAQVSGAKQNRPAIIRDGSNLHFSQKSVRKMTSESKHDKVQMSASARKKQDGASNWMKLCATLNIDGAKRKTKTLKRALSNDVAEQGEHSEVKRTKLGVWFDNVDKILIETEPTEQSRVGTGGDIDGKQITDPLVKPGSFKGLTNCVAMDCEMVGFGPKGEESILARVSVVNHFGVCLYDKFVQPREKVTDYRTHVSGVTAQLLSTGEEFTKVQSEVSGLIKDRILVGHAVHNDLKVLFLTHPHRMIRDTSLYKPFRELFKGRLPSLKKLTDKVLGVSVQEGQHSSVQDAQATMRLYTMYRQKWEKQLRQDRKLGRNRKRKKKQAKEENV